MANVNEDHYRQHHHHPVGYGREKLILTSNSSSIDPINPYSYPNYYDPESLLPSLSALNLSSSSSLSSYPQQQQQSIYPTNYYDSVFSGLSVNDEYYRQFSYQTVEQSLNFPSFDLMMDQNDFNSGFINGGRQYMYSSGDQWNLHPRGNQLYQNDSSFLYNKNDQRGYPLKTHLSNEPNRRIRCVYDFNQSDNGFGYNPYSVKHGSSNYHHRLGRNMNFSLSDLKGEILTYAKDQYLCRLLQEKFVSPSQEDVEMIVFEVTGYLEELMTNQYGNYFFQKLVDVCNEDQKTRIIWSLCRHPFQLVVICQNVHGSRSVQKLLEHVRTPDHISLIISALTPGTADLATDTQGHHVIQYCLRNFTNEDNEQLIRAMAEKCFQIATSKSGCVLLHLCVVSCQGQFKAILLREIIANSLHLAEDPFGNYVVQHMLELMLSKVNASILNQLKGNFFAFSRSKFASNVVQKCLTLTEPAQAEQVIIELIENPNISVLLVDPFGNFVIQSAFAASQGRVRTRLLDIIIQNVPIMRSNLYGKKVIQMLERRRIRIV
ncbi:putative pumilio homolog 8, chloroplastic [Impatiens glandulifera]|uniref:putative pumilio homolog 8, chloroplastic n=1 Tax=Impatiens glandulifera TaxID=253017 RepID=UPI001FB0F58B|nr:putative pumilio homolog 8, chloroplastic [Impatiens glandulifera]